MNSTPGSHSLAFRVMRLCRPSFHVDHPLRVDPADLLVGEDIFDDPVAASELPRLIDSHVVKPNDASDLSYRSRFLLRDPSDPMGLSGLLVLPQAFGAIYLGETFCSYISINNSSNFEVKDVIIKAEIQTERQKILLLDTSKSPVESIRAGGRYDFIVEHDVKELGAHTLVCTALYNDGDGERKYLPQFFKFMVANPLSVRTKVRVVKDSAQTIVEGSNILGKLQITWRTNLGEPGRLQTQQILGTPITRSDVDLHVVEVPSVINLEKSFLLHLKLANKTERELGPFEVSLSQNGLHEEKAVVINGLQTMIFVDLD
ncbi:Trafficking protein particle complex subunit 13 [Morella rubra]|uniref:Trafficking protein particle complex subunit 13 n=1 Tax=Morella rubra TaxID=262757 RepID=A0A6A1W9I1_9ROSI|nr:Trafficking protein particle complex subunit 13 [Morella rubra]